MGVLGDLNHTPLKGGKSKSKTPLKSQRPAPVGMLSPNNDALEKRRNKLARQASETTRRWVGFPSLSLSPFFSPLRPDTTFLILDNHVSSSSSSSAPPCYEMSR